MHTLIDVDRHLLYGDEPKFTDQDVELAKRRMQHLSEEISMMLHSALIAVNSVSIPDVEIGTIVLVPDVTLYAPSQNTLGLFEIGKQVGRLHVYPVHVYGGACVEFDITLYGVRLRTPPIPVEHALESLRKEIKKYWNLDLWVKQS